MMPKISDTELARWEQLLQSRFPGTRLRRADGLPNCGHPMIHAYNIPDELRDEFFDFTMRDIIEFVDKHKLVDIDFLSSSVSETLQYHPEIAEPALAAK